MSELELRPDEQILDQRGGDFGKGIMMNPGICVLTNQRVIVCSIKKPRSELKGAIAGVGAKAMGAGTEMAMHVINLALALKSNKPLYPVFEQPFENLKSITPYRWGLGCGVRIQTPEVTKFCVKFGLGRTRDQWIEIFKATVEQHCPHLEVAQSDNSMTVARRQTNPVSRQALVTPSSPPTRTPQQPPPTTPPLTPQLAPSSPPAAQPAITPPGPVERQPDDEEATFIVCRDGKKSRPVTLTDLLTQVRGGKLRPDDTIVSLKGGDSFSARSLIDNVE